MLQKSHQQQGQLQARNASKLHYQHAEHCLPWELVLSWEVVEEGRRKGTENYHPSRAAEAEELLRPGLH